MTFSAPKQAWFPGFASNGDRGCVSAAAAAYPEQLSALPRPPKALWWTGRLPADGERLVAIVGARAATRTACEQASAIAHGLAATGTAIVSGGAFGIDAAAHEGALAAAGSTFAVLGCGTDVVYPDRHARLFERIRSAGGLLSEYAPGTPPRAGQFPARNRIIAGLSAAVIVVEAAAQSGALITARWAEKLQKPVFALPGSSGTDALLRAGKAHVVFCARDVERGLAGELLPSPVAVQPAIEFSPLLDAIAQGAVTPVEIGRQLGASLPSVLGMLAQAEIDGWIRRHAGGIYEVIGRGC